MQPMYPKISSSSLFITKKVFPALWFGFLVFFIVFDFTSGLFSKAPLVLVGPLVMAAFGFVLMKKIVWDLMDEVYDCGDSLLVKNGGREETIKLSDIIGVSVSTLLNPPRITLRLARPGPLGSEIAFSPARPFTLNPFAKFPIAEDLIVRVDKARVARIR